MMRVVLDTNILVRIVASPQGPAAELFDRLRAKHLLVTSTELLSELSQTLAYERVRKIHGLSDAALEQFVQGIESGSLVVALPEPLPRVVPHDPDDDFVVATAIAGNADVLCTRNKHLLHADVVAYCAERSVRILDDLQLLEEFRAFDEPTAE